MVEGEPGTRASSPRRPGDRRRRLLALVAAGAVVLWWLSPAESAPQGDPGSHSFLRLHADGTPVTWDRCRPINVVMNARTAPPEGEQLLQEALGRVAEATGLRFVLEGATHEPPTRRRPVSQPGTYGDRFAPVLVAWSDPGEWSHLEGDVVGTAGGGPVIHGGRMHVYVTGTIVLDGPQMRDLLGRRGGRAAARAVIMHELGHLVGLGHVDDPSQLMYEGADPRTTEFQAGDLAGLDTLGRGRCFDGL